MRKSVVGALVTSVTAATVVGLAGVGSAGGSEGTESPAFWGFTSPISMELDEEHLLAIRDQAHLNIALDADASLMVLDAPADKRLVMSLPDANRTVRVKGNTVVDITGSGVIQAFDNARVYIHQPEGVNNWLPRVETHDSAQAIADDFTGSMGFPATTPVLKGGELLFGDYKRLSAPTYIEKWEQTYNRPMSETGRANLERRCLGPNIIHNVEKGLDQGLALSFGTFEKAREVRFALHRVLKSSPTPELFEKMVSEDPTLRDLRNISDSISDLDLSKVTPIIFSMRFHTRSWKGEEPVAPDPETGQVDMSKFTLEDRPVYSNFTLGWWDEDTNNWWHTTHSRGCVDQSTLEHFSTPSLQFDNQVYAVAFADKS